MTKTEEEGRETIGENELVMLNGEGLEQKAEEDDAADNETSDSVEEDSSDGDEEEEEKEACVILQWSAGTTAIKPVDYGDDSDEDYDSDDDEDDDSDDDNDEDDDSDDDDDDEDDDSDDDDDEYGDSDDSDDDDDKEYDELAIMTLYHGKIYGIRWKIDSTELMDREDSEEVSSDGKTDEEKVKELEEPDGQLQYKEGYTLNGEWDSSDLVKYPQSNGATVNPE